MSEYEYNYTYVAPLAFVEKVPRQDRPTLSWYMKVIQTSLKISKNRISVKPASPADELAGMGASESGIVSLEHLGVEAIDLLKEDLDIDLEKHQAASNDELGGMGFLDLGLATKIATMAGNLFEKGITNPFGIFDAVTKQIEGPKGRPTSFSEYAALFKTIPLPDWAGTAGDDATFASMRVAGWNPVVLEAVAMVDDSFPVTDAHLVAAGLAGDSLAAAGAQGRLFLADYKALAKLRNGNFPLGPKYCYAPKALFVRPATSGRLVPVAIQCGQDASAYPIFGPHDGEAWSRAKFVVTCADANHHELVSHLGMTHLVVGPVAIATPRRLAADHPIRVLLSPHLEGTLSINDAAQAMLIKEGHQVDKALGGTINASRGVSAEAVMNLDFEGHWLPNALQRRGVTDPALEYPYRDDALKIWAAVEQWVWANVMDAYPTDADLREDTSLAAWVAEIASKDGGRLYTFGEGGQGGTISTRSWLVGALTMIIFTASSQHAAVNFAQAEIMSYTPSAPVAGYRAAPASKDDALLSDPLDILPPMEMALLQLEFLQLLGGVHYTALGQYPRGHFGPNLRPAMEAFQARLAEIETEIDHANVTRIKYTLLKPSRTPQSINI